MENGTEHEIIAKMIKYWIAVQPKQNHVVDLHLFGKLIAQIYLLDYEIFADVMNSFNPHQ